MPPASFSSIAWKVTVVHTVTYFLVGLLAFALLDYSGRYADPVVAGSLRQTSDPLVSAGPLFQVVRGFLFGVVWYALRDIIITPRRGWLTLWLVLVVVGIFSTFSAAPGSIEGMIYSRLPLWFHVLSLPELLVQSLLLAFVSHYWINHPEQRWLGRVLVACFVLVVVLAGLGLFAAVSR